MKNFTTVARLVVSGLILCLPALGQAQNVTNIADREVARRQARIPHGEEISREAEGDAERAEIRAGRNPARPRGARSGVGPRDGAASLPREAPGIRASPPGRTGAAGNESRCRSRSGGTARSRARGRRAALGGGTERPASRGSRRAPADERTGHVFEPRRRERLVEASNPAKDIGPDRERRRGGLLDLEGRFRVPLGVAKTPAKPVVRREVVEEKELPRVVAKPGKPPQLERELVFAPRRREPPGAGAGTFGGVDQPRRNRDDAAAGPEPRAISEKGSPSARVPGSGSGGRRPAPHRPRQ